MMFIQAICHSWFVMEAAHQSIKNALQINYSKQT